MQIDISVPKHVVEQCRALVAKIVPIRPVGTLYPVVSNGVWIGDYIVNLNDGTAATLMWETVCYHSDGTRTYPRPNKLIEMKSAGAIHCRFIQDHYFEIPCPHCDGTGVACNFEPEFPEVPK